MEDLGHRDVVRARVAEHVGHRIRLADTPKQVQPITMPSSPSKNDLGRAVRRTGLAAPWALHGSWVPSAGRAAPRDRRATASSRRRVEVVQKRDHLGRRAGGEQTWTSASACTTPVQDRWAEHVARCVDAVVMQGAEADTAVVRAKTHRCCIAAFRSALSRCIAAARGTQCRDRAARGGAPVSGELAARAMGPSKERGAICCRVSVSRRALDDAAVRSATRKSIRPAAGAACAVQVVPDAGRPSTTATSGAVSRRPSANAGPVRRTLRCRRRGRRSSASLVQFESLCIACSLSRGSGGIRRRSHVQTLGSRPLGRRSIFLSSSFMIVNASDIRG